MSVRILSQNYLDIDLISNLTFSSEQTAFPVINALNLNRRSKVWRSNGYWKITSSNNQIIFRESIGIELTANVAVGEYSSSDDLYIAIKAALELVGASTYTVSSDSSTLKVKIVSDGLGGGGVLQINWPDSSMATILGFSTDEEDTGVLSYVADQLRISTGEWIQFDFGISTLPTAFILIGARNRPIRITPSATITLQGNETNVWNPGVIHSEIVLDYNAAVISTINEDGLWDEALRYSRILIEDLSNPEGFVEIGALFLGIFFQGTRGQVQFPFQAQYIDNSRTSFSEGGQTFSDIREKSEGFDIEWFGLTISEKEEIDDLWDNLGVSNPFFIQYDPNQAFSSEPANMIRYVKFAQPPRYELVSPGNFRCNMSLREEL